MIPATEYHAVIVRPSLDEFYARNGDLRLAVHAAISLTHAIDYVFQNRGPNPKAAGSAAENYRRDLVERCFSFRVVEGFAMASKHCTMNRADLKGFSSSEQGRYHPSVAGRMIAGRFLAGDAVAGVCVRWLGHGWVNLTKALRASCAILETELPDLTAAPPGPSPPVNAP